MGTERPETRKAETDSAAELLREVLSILAGRLQAREEWRALRQLDERERNGSPLQSLDGVLLRGRLVRQLAASSPD